LCARNRGRDAFFLAVLRILPTFDSAVNYFDTAVIPVPKRRIMVPQEPILEEADMDKSSPAVRSVLIVGGGTAGWMTANVLARHLGAGAPGGVQISLVESSQIGIIGVGEASFPSIRGTLAFIGLDEARFLRECEGTFKQGITFVDWLRPPGSPGANHYFHPFSLPSQRPGAPELLPYWLMGQAGAGRAFAEATTLQKRLVDAGRGPKRASDGAFAGTMNYAYHFNAGRLATLLAGHGRSLGVRHLLGNVDRVQLDEHGAIAAVHTREGAELRADLYVDCTGFRALLIGATLGAPLRSAGDTLFNDRALALQVPYPSGDTPIASSTIASAREAGWIWDIGLQERRGVGYVYSSRHTSDERAEEVLREYVGTAAAGLVPNALKLNIGYRDRQWVKNCVAIGLSGGFIEPIESSGVGLIETAAFLLAFGFPFDGQFEPVARRYNDFMRGRYERIVDFVKMHYCLTRRTDTAFWVDNAAPASIPATLRELLDMWRWRTPNRLDFLTDLEMYQPASWQFVLYGMEYPTQLAAGAAAFPRAAEARREFEMIRQLSQRALDDLPAHRALVERLCAGAEAPAGA
jgi:tryptophan halogenase